MVPSEAEQKAVFNWGLKHPEIKKIEKFLVQFQFLDFIEQK